ncbi:MAG: Mini-ribonuclease 3 [Bacillota bacterium]
MQDWNRFFSGMGTEQPHLLPPLVLAYIGDAVYELMVRRHVLNRGFTRTDRIHKETVRYVSAGTQARVFMSIEGMLSEEEAGIARRGRNAKSAHFPRSADVISYRRSTGLECLVGYLFLRGDLDRLAWIMERIFSLVENED